MDDKEILKIATGILYAAVQDWTKVRKSKSDESIKLRLQLIDFFMSDWFSDLCCAARVDDEWLLENIGIKWRYVRMEDRNLTKGPSYE